MSNENGTVDKLLNILAIIVLISALVSVTEAIGAALGVWLFVAWSIIYMKMLATKLVYEHNFNSGNYYIPTSRTDDGVYMLFDGTATQDTVFGYILFIMIGLAIIVAIGRVVYGSNWQKGLLWFWTPILVWPLFMYETGIIKYYPGGSTAYVETYYRKTCEPQVNKNTEPKCVWHGPVTKPPF